MLYSHRSNTLHAMIACNTDTMGLSNRDTILPVVPMFHANAWGIAFAAPMVGAKLVMPGPRLDGPSLCALLNEEEVTMTAAVPTVWLGLLPYLEETNQTLPHLRRVLIGGSACPRAMIETFERKYGIDVIHAWGMTEMSPLGTLGTLKAKQAKLPPEQRLDYKARQGYPPFGVEMKIVGDDDRELPRDGKTFGRLKVRGPAVSKAYFRGDGATAYRRRGLVRHWRRRDAGRGRLHDHHRPRQGRHQIGRRMDFLHRDRESGHGPPGGGRSRGDRRATIPNGTNGRCWLSCSNPAST